MHRVARLVLAALAAQTATGFVLPQRHYSSSFQLGVILSSQTAARDVGVKIFDDENAIRTAYDEWRSEFGKGDFDDNRYEQFKQNFKILTVANFEAIEKAVAAGTNPPGWMYLNEYGDFSQAEYDAITVESNVDTYKVYEDWCDEFGVKADANRYEIFLANYKSMKSYAKKTGKNLKLNKFADWTKSEAENGSKDDPKPEPKPEPISEPKVAAQSPSTQPKPTTTVEPIANKEMKEFIQQRGTRVLQYANGISSVERTTTPRATLALGTQAYTSDTQGTRRVTPTTQGTRKVSGSDFTLPPHRQGTRRVGGVEPVANQPPYGTQRIAQTGTTPPANQSFQGTRQITSVSGNGQGTRVIQSAGASGTRAIQPGTPNGTGQPFQGTRAIQPGTPNGTGQPVQGTRTIQPGTPNGAGQPFQGTRAIQPGTPNGAGQPFQGTRAIQPGTPNGAGQLFQGTRAITPNGAGTRTIQPGNPAQSFPGTRQIPSVNGDNAQGTRSIVAGEQSFQGTRRISDIPQQRPFRGTIPLDQPPEET